MVTTSCGNGGSSVNPKWFHLPGCELPSPSSHSLMLEKGQWVQRTGSRGVRNPVKGVTKETIGGRELRDGSFEGGKNLCGNGTGGVTISAHKNW